MRRYSRLYVIDALRHVADQAGTTMARAALAWIRRRPGVASVLIGARSLEQLDDNLGSLDVELTDEQLHELTDASTPRLNFPASTTPASHQCSPSAA